MKISVEYNTKFGDIQKAFNEQYPFLKMEPVASSNGNGTAMRFSSQTFLRDLPAAVTVPYILNIEGTTTIAELESDLLSTLKLPVQVLRKSGSMWIGTSLTKDWTLEHQNKEGELFSKEIIR